MARRRKALDERRIETGTGSYRLILDDDELDAWVFESLIRRATGANGLDGVTRPTELDEALGLWRGQAFGRLGDEPPFDVERQRLDTLRRVASDGAWQRQTMTMNVASLGHTWCQSVADNPSGPDDFRMPFLVEGTIYPEGTFGDGFVPTDDAAIGRWFCQGWLLENPDRPEPHVSSRQVYVFGSVTEDELFPSDTMSSLGLEGTSAGQVLTRMVVGGTGRYMGASGQVLEIGKGTNTTVMDDGTGDLAPKLHARIRLLPPRVVGISRLLGWPLWPAPRYRRRPPPG